jgi:hypothetical protein
MNKRPLSFILLPVICLLALSAFGSLFPFKTAPKSDTLPVQSPQDFITAVNAADTQTQNALNTVANTLLQNQSTTAPPPLSAPAAPAIQQPASTPAPTTTPDTQNTQTAPPSSSTTDSSSTPETQNTTTPSSTNSGNGFNNIYSPQ